MSGRGHHIKIRDLEGDTLLTAYRCTERSALHRIPRRQLQTRPDTSKCKSRNPDAPTVQDRKELLIPLSAGTQKMIFGQVYVDEGQRMGIGGMPAELGIARTYLEAGCPHGHDDRGDLRIAGLAGARTRRDRADRSDVGPGIGDELLAAVDHPFMITQGRTGPSRARIGSSLWLRQPESGQSASGEQIGQPPRLLLRCAEVRDWVDAEPDGRLQSDSE